jgi:hypothetical protein
MKYDVMKDRLLISLVIVVGCAVVARGQTSPLLLQVDGGLVTLHAHNVPVRTILAEWARLGGARIVNGDRVAGAPVTLDLERVPERQALDIILRGVSGYMLATREPGAVGSSNFDRIVILPTSMAPPNPVPAFAIVPGAQPIAPRIQGADRPDDVTEISGVPSDLNRAVPVPRPAEVPRQSPIGMPGAVQVPPAGAFPAAQPPVVSTPSNPFGVPTGSSARPGEIVAVPQIPVGDSSPDPNRPGSTGIK